jgi:hypothetical protein
MTVTLSLTEADVFRVLGDYLTSVLPNTVEIIRGQVNRTASPLVSDYVVMTSNFRSRLETNISSWDEVGPNPVVISYLEPTQFVAQVDVIGPGSADNSQVISALFRSENATNFFATSGVDMQPLFVEDPKQIPFIGGEQQFQERWTIDAVMQINPVVTVTQDFMNQAVVVLKEVDAYYPP